MGTFYLDTSALVKRYMLEIGSEWILALVDPEADNTIVVSEITRVEAAAAIAARQHAPGGMSQDIRDEIVSSMLQHFDTQYQVVPLDTAIIDDAVALTQQYRLRGYDAVQLATVLLVNQRYTEVGFDSITFVAADNDLLAAAAAQGLGTENPNEHP